MDGKSVFNAVVCIIGIAILLIHILDVALKKDKRKDEKNLLSFLSFTVIHFATYLSFTFIKAQYTSNTLIMTFYTIFYIMNNVELLLLSTYAVSYISITKRSRKNFTIANFVLFGIIVVFDIINIFTHIFFYAENGIYMRAKMMILSQGYQFIGFAMVFFMAVFSRKLNINEKISFAAYCILPFIAIIIQNLLPGYAIAYLSIVISIEILFLFVNVKKNLSLAHEAKRNKEAEIKLMMSQIQPHFIYNTLSSISTLIKIDPDKAQVALDNFTEFLRTNLSSLSDTKLINFANELRHIETYLSLEELRFNDRLHVIYEIGTTDFLVPPLSIQPLVENAVKHGILQKIEGGTVIIKTYEDEQAYYVEVIDDGVGFDPNDPELEDNKHIGLNNVRYRLSTMLNSDMSIISEVDKGTKIVVLFYK